MNMKRLGLVLGLGVAVWLVAAITFISGLIVAARMTETLVRRRL